MKKIVLSIAGALALLSGCAADVAPATEAVRQTCGGFAGTPCPEGFTCVDDPRDRCDPASGGADCSGVCRRTRCRYNDPSKRYVARSPAECATIRFVCEPGTEYFADDCGCGCQDAASACTTIALCVEGYVWSDATCACEPAPGESCGPVTCAAGEVCCNASCGLCTPPDGVCTQQACTDL